MIFLITVLGSDSGSPPLEFFNLREALGLLTKEPGDISLLLDRTWKLHCLVVGIAGRDWRKSRLKHRELIHFLFWLLPTCLPQFGSFYNRVMRDRSVTLKQKYLRLVEFLNEDTILRSFGRFSVCERSLVLIWRELGLFSLPVWALRNVETLQLGSIEAVVGDLSRIHVLLLLVCLC